MKNGKTSVLGVVVIVLSTLVASCGGGSGTNTAGESAVKTVNLTPNIVSEYWGKTVKVSAQPADNAGVPVAGETITYKSSNENVATVSATGVVSLLNPGTTYVTATVGGVVSNSSIIESKGFAFDSLSVNWKDNCALDDTKTEILCWGDGYPIRKNLTDQLNYPSPLKLLMGTIPSGTILKQIEPGFYYSCVLASDGTVYCWQGAAESPNEILGMGTNNQTPTGQPALVQRGEIPIGAKIIKLINGGWNTCALVDDGGVYCWGKVDRTPRPEKLWNPSASYYTYPVKVGASSQGVKFVDYAKGLDRDCALSETGHLYCGTVGNNNTSSFLTLQTQVSSEVPIDVKLIKLKSSNGVHNFMMALGDDGWTYSFGGGFGRQYGNGSAAFVGEADKYKLIRTVQGDINLGVKIVDFSVGGLASVNCVVGDNGRAYCWSNGYMGSAGDGNMMTHEILSPQLVLQGQLPQGVGISNIACGTYHCSVLATDRKVYAWGYSEGAATGGTDSVAVPTLINKVGN